MFRFLARLFGPRKPRAGAKAPLLSLHLSQMNTKKSLSSEIQKSRDRDNGKFTHDRSSA